MFDLDSWTEIFSTIKKNKLRTFLTGFSVSWGIFMFCILLSAGNGLRNGMGSNFGSRSVNAIEYWGRQTSMPYQGFPDSRLIQLDEKDLYLAQTGFSEIDLVTPMLFRTLNVNYGNISQSVDFTGIYPNYTTIHGITIKDNQGRFINDMDMKDKRKVVVINERMKEVLFNNSDPVGKILTVEKLNYTVIGVFDEESWGNRARAYIPFSTAQLLYNKGGGLQNVAFTVEGLNTKEANEVFEKAYREKVSQIHHYDPRDERAIGMWNQLSNYLETVGIFNASSAFIWIIGIGTLMAGIVGVSNIMLITVRERTREFGIRKALGAKPSSILMSIIAESILITSVFGYIGMFLGVGLGELVNSILQTPGMEEASRIFKNPTIDVNVALGAMLVLVVSGVFAGYFPALKAVKISAVEAMRTE